MCPLSFTHIYCKLCPETRLILNSGFTQPHQVNDVITITGTDSVRVSASGLAHSKKQKARYGCTHWVQVPTTLVRSCPLLAHPDEPQIRNIPGVCRKDVSGLGHLPFLEATLKSSVL